MSANPWDVAVVGGGPAGCSAAITLARRGLRVVLLEAKTYPHDKMCGEFLSPECAGLLTDLGLGERLPGLHPASINTATLTASDGSAWESRLPGTALGISRKVLDAALAEEAQRAGVTVCESANVRAIVGNLHDGFELDVETRRGHAARTISIPVTGGGPAVAGSAGESSQTVYARAVIAAHGKRAALDRALGRRFLEKCHPFIAIKAHFHGPPIPGRIELHAFPGGYCGISEIEDGAKVLCLLVDEKVFHAHKGNPGNLDGFVEWMQSQNLYLRTWLQWAERIHQRWITIAQVPFDPKPLVERDVLMAGDAAALIAPLAGNGIAMALQGGRMAANHLGDFLIGAISADGLRRAYPAAWKRRFQLRLSLGRMLQSVMLRPRALPTTLQMLNRFPGMGQFLIAKTRD